MKENGQDAAAQKKEWAGFVEYVMYLQDTRRLLLANFFAGLLRGIGFTVGFSLLGALILLFVRHLALTNLPGIGAFFAEVVRIVQLKLY